MASESNVHIDGQNCWYSKKEQAGLSANQELHMNAMSNKSPAQETDTHADGINGGKTEKNGVNAEDMTSTKDNYEMTGKEESKSAEQDAKNTSRSEKTDLVTTCCSSSVSVTGRCPHCDDDIQTAVHYRMGSAALRIFCLMCIVCCIPCVIIFLVTKYKKDVEHSCPKCKKLIARYVCPDTLPAAPLKRQKIKRSWQTTDVPAVGHGL